MTANTAATGHAAVVELTRLALERPHAETCVQRAVELVSAVLRCPDTAVVRGPGSSERGTAGATTVPVVAGGRCWGWLEVRSPVDRVLQVDELAFVQAVAHVVAVAVERERSEQGRATLTALGRHALQSDDIRSTMYRAVEAAAQVMVTPQALLVRPGTVEGRMTVMASFGPVAVPTDQEYDIDPELWSSTPSRARTPRPMWTSSSRSPMRWPPRWNATRSRRHGCG